jgi:hypothetical protein
MSLHLRLRFPEDGVVAVATLLEDAAPETCRAIWERLPFQGELWHAMWSGPETYLHIDPGIRIGPENQTFHTLPGDVGYYCLEGGRLMDWREDMAELAFFYDRGARPSMMDGPVPMNIFGRIVDNLTGFAQMCRRIHREGVKPFRVERSE